MLCFSISSAALLLAPLGMPSVLEGISRLFREKEKEIIKIPKLKERYLSLVEFLLLETTSEKRAFHQRLFERLLA